MNLPTQSLHIQSRKLKDDLKLYSGVAGAVIGMTSLAQGQVVYTDLNPDVILSDDDTSYFINFNQDTINDLAIQQGMTQGSGYDYNWVDVNSNGVGEIMIYNKILLGNTYAFASALNQNDSINQNADWQSNGTMGWVGTYNNQPINEGAWRGTTDKFLGVRFNVNGQWHYGWVRLDVSLDCDSAVIKDYAYNATPDSAINAGDVGLPVGINGIAELKNIEAYSHGKSLFLSIKDQEIADFSIQLYNMLGEQVYTAGLSGSRHEIRLNDFTTGMYVAVVKSEGKEFRKKFYLN